MNKFTTLLSAGLIILASSAQASKAPAQQPAVAHVVASGPVVAKTFVARKCIVDSGMGMRSICICPKHKPLLSSCDSYKALGDEEPKNSAAFEKK